MPAPRYPTAPDVWEESEHMAVSHTPAPADHGPTAHALNRAAARPPHPPPPVRFPDQALWARVIRNARCADSSLDPDQWFPASAEPDKARREAAAAITVCVTCFVRTQCLELSLRSWDIGQYGVWGGMVPADRAALRRRKQHPKTIRPVPRP
jgi:Transcription factor WhiB